LPLQEGEKHQEHSHSHSHPHSDSHSHSEEGEEVGHTHSVFREMLADKNVHDKNSEEYAKLSKWLMIAALEFGTALHSIGIGIAVGVARSPEFEPLFIAILFHQLFEGMSIGTRRADPQSKIKKVVAATLILLYSLTTPIGVVIGIGIHNRYAPYSTQALLVNGTIDSIAAGFVLYNSIVLLHDFFLTEHFLNRKPYDRIIEFLFLIFGAGIMSYIGRYA